MRTQRHDLIRAASDSSPLRVFIYCRISQDREGLELGVRRQEEDCRALCERNGWEVVRVFIDNDLGASTRSRRKRTDYEAMIALARTGHGDVIVSYSNSRLTRRPLELEDLIQLHERHGTLLATVVSGMDDLSTADGRMTARIKAAVDAAEAERTGERVKRAQQQKRAEGEPLGGVPVFGYVHPTPENGYRYLQVVDKAAEAAIRQAVDVLFAGGRVADVQRLWNAAGLLTPKGKTWDHIGNVSRALCSPRLAGLVTHGGEIVGEGKWPAIIDRGTHERLVEILTAGKDGKPRPRKHLLGGFVYCLCGAKMRAQVWTPPDDRSYNATNRYVCITTFGGCGRNVRYRPWLDAMVQEYVAGRIEAEYEGTGPIVEDDPYAEIDQEIASKEAEIRRLRGAYAAGVFTLAEVSEAVIPLREDIQNLRAQQGEMAQETAASSIDKDEALEVWFSDDPYSIGQRVSILADYVHRVVVKPPPNGERWGVATADIPVDSIEIIPAPRRTSGSAGQSG